MIRYQLMMSMLRLPDHLSLLHLMIQTLCVFSSAVAAGNCCYQLSVVCHHINPKYRYSCSSNVIGVLRHQKGDDCTHVPKSLPTTLYFCFQCKQTLWICNTSTKAFVQDQRDFANHELTPLPPLLVIIQ